VFPFLKFWRGKVIIAPVVEAGKEISLSDDEVESLKDPVDEIALKRKITSMAEAPKQEASVKKERTLIFPL
jgi:hypothetical protein